ncbi:sulfite oxidase [Nakamurella sp. GG22]
MPTQETAPPGIPGQSTTTTGYAFSTEGRLASPDEGISVEELQLAARNHAMPLEALRYDVTPIGLHYLLTHYDIPDVDPANWQLTIGGHVEREITLDAGTLRAGARQTRRVTMECAGNGRALLSPRPVSQPWLTEAVGTAEWTGVAVSDLLAEARPLPGAVDVAFTGADHGIERGVEQDYARGLSMSDATDPSVIVADEMNGQPLPPQHGAPARLIVPGWYGMAHVKWLRRITVLDRRFDGFQNVTAYRIRQDTEPGEPVMRIVPRALMAPPGHPDFMSRIRLVDPGPVLLTGRAWSGRSPLRGVQVSTDGGAHWHEAALGPSAGRWAWRPWSLHWDARDPGPAELLCRATDESGTTQPVDQPWNRQGVANNMVQRVRVVVRG